MPHCIVEYSQNLEQEVAPADWLEAVKNACIASQLFSVEDIKLRSLPFKNYISAGPEDAFVHVTIRLLSGRSSEQKKDLSERILASLLSLPVSNISLSVEMRDMDRDCYSKRVVLSP